ncbi:PEP-CTERM sorting domain-containing protein [Stieleria maiorica]|uniref:PEP-CTERM sorting domain-containing protein n=1 Tax=Stieleria maiorica TaxID=2795974 RepID=UPI00142F3716|nr:PEP-CTERM sorting domain-containing protein [Stieleria maiorica]
MNRSPWRTFTPFIPACLFCLVIGWSQMAQADVIARFEFEGNDYTTETSNPSGFNTGLNLSSSVSNAGVTVSELQFSRNLDPTAALGFAADDYDNALGFSTDENDDRSLEFTNQVVYFDVNVHVGFRLNLQSISFDSLKTRGTNTSGARVTYSLFVNPEGDPAVDGLLGDTDFLTNVAHDHHAPGEAGAESTGEDFSTGRWNTGPIDLNGVQAAAGTNTFALRLYGSEGATSDQDFGIDNLILSGQVTAIPEPATTAVILLSITAASWRRRRSQQA